MCAIVGVTHNHHAQETVFLGLHALQHRGQEGAGMLAHREDAAQVYRRPGLVQDVFPGSVLSTLETQHAIGHTRYSTVGEKENTTSYQPLYMQTKFGWLGLVHNGNLVNAAEIKENLRLGGAIFQTETDTEIIIHLLTRSPKDDFKEALREALSQVKGAYSLILLRENQMMVMRDPHGFRPLVMGKKGDGYVFASEDCAFHLMEAEFVREVQKGELITIDLETQQLKSETLLEPVIPGRRCVFEHIYFSRPDSNVFSQSVYEVRKQLGRQLAKESPIEADMVIPVPDSGVGAAIGYSSESGIPFEFGIIRSHYVGRTFIEPQQKIRSYGVRLKLTPMKTILEGKRIVLIDDSLVRGTTTTKLLYLLRQAGVKEIHVRISSPPITSPCYYGIDTPNKNELIASSHSVEQITETINADSLAYLSVEGLSSLFKNQEEPSGYCHSCFTGQYVH